MFETQKSGNKTSPGEIGHDIRTHASPKVGQDHVSGRVSVPCQYATSAADALWKHIFSIVKFSKKSNQGKGHEFVVSNQGRVKFGKKSNQVKNRELVV